MFVPLRTGNESFRWPIEIRSILQEKVQQLRREVRGHLDKLLFRKFVGAFFEHALDSCLALPYLTGRQWHEEFLTLVLQT